MASPDALEPNTNLGWRRPRRRKSPWYTVGNHCMLCHPKRLSGAFAAFVLAHCPTLADDLGLPVRLELLLWNPVGALLRACLRRRRRIRDAVAGTAPISDELDEAVVPLPLAAEQGG